MEGPGPAIAARPEFEKLTNEVAALKFKVKDIENEVEVGRAERWEMWERMPGPSPIELAAEKGRSWGPEQATGPPDTGDPGDIPTAWAPAEPDAGEEWLHLSYDELVNISEVRILETHNPGAISKVAAVLPNGSEQIIWEGVGETHEPPVETGYAVMDNLLADELVVYLDTTRVEGWNEIDAVGLIAKDGTQQWASSVSASSSYADQYDGDTLIEGPSEFSLE